MTRFRFFVLSICLTALACALGCGSSVTNDPPPPPEPEEGLFGDLDFGDAATFDVVTWNLQTYPRANAQTVEYAAEAILAMDADVVAVQEIMSWAAFDLLVEAVADEGYDGHHATSDDYMDLGYIWKTDTVSDISFEEPLQDWQAFPRYPLMMRLTYAGVPFVLVNNHFKCCGDGQIEDGNTDDEEYRRLLACRQLDSWIDTAAPDANLILLGDLNDKLDDPVSQNVFTVFLDDPDHYRFADLPLADSSQSSSWSWRLSSHIDHIMVTDELFPAVEHADAEVRTLRLDQPLEGGISEYNDMLSDHFPVGLRLKIGP